MLIRLPHGLLLAALVVSPLTTHAKAHRPAPAKRPVKVAAPADGPAYGARDDVLQFAAEAARLHPALNQADIAQALAGARYQPLVARYIMPAATPSAKNWAAYRARFIEPRRLQAGLSFWQANGAWLNEAEARWGVPPALVVAIVGIETLYGQHTGGFRALDALATLSFDFPSGRSDRSAFFRQELRALFMLAAREGVDPASLRSSYAGAMGLPQFMPSTWLKYAADLDGDGHIDLHRSAADVIGSVARYLAAEGWQRGLPTHFEVRPPEDEAQRAVLLAPDILPSFTPAEMQSRGAQLPVAAQTHPGLLALVQLHNGEAAPSYIAGTDNFWVVTRYNWSSYYALAVIEFAQALRQARDHPSPRAPP